MWTLPLASPILRRAPRGDGHPVLVLPGFMADDRSTVLLRRYLGWLGYAVHGWQLGRNLDHRATGPGGELLARRIGTIQKSASAKVTLIGWSLGGIVARDAARRDPDSVRQVITLGSPLIGDRGGLRLSRLFQLLTGQRLDSPEMSRRMEELPPVPYTAIYSKTDGLVDWRTCLRRGHDRMENLEVYGSHCGLGMNPAVLYAVADRLALPENEWNPFDRSGWRAAFYPPQNQVH